MLVLDPELSAKTLIAFSYSLTGFISSPVSLILILGAEYSSGGDLVIR